MIEFAKAWLLKLFSGAILVSSIGVALFVVAGGTPQQDDRAARVSPASTLEHMLAGNEETPSGEADFEGCWTVLPPPSRDELDENLRKSIASKFRRDEHSSAMADE